MQHLVNSSCSGSSASHGLHRKKKLVSEWRPAGDSGGGGVTVPMNVEFNLYLNE